MRRLQIAGTALFALAAIAAGAVWVGSRVQQHAFAAQRDYLHHAATLSTPTSPASDHLPEPVARYLRWALPAPGAIRLVHLQQTGTLRTDVRSDSWMRFTAEHHVAPHAVGFAWNARVRVAPLLHVRVRDAYIDGKGSGRVALLSAFPVGGAEDTPEMNSGSLHRFLAEAVWYPTALLPSERLRWTAIDATRSLATLTDRGTSVSLEFRFSETGEVAGIYTPARWGSFDGGYEQRPWEGHFHNYAQRGGMFVPSEGDVGWYVDGTWRAVWIGSVTRYDVDRAPD